jgi:hypothetical protein
MTRIAVALFNYQDGGLRSGTRDFRPLQRALREAETPALFFYCEGKRFLANGGEGLYWCAEALSDQFAVPYIPLPGTMRQGPMGPVIFYNPNLLVARTGGTGGIPTSSSTGATSAGSPCAIVARRETAVPGGFDHQIARHCP